MRLTQLLRKKRLPDDLFSPEYPLSLDNDIAQHAAFLYRGIFRRPYGKQVGDRIFHGIAHMSNVAIYIPLLTKLYKRTLTNEDEKLLQLAALFHDAGREGDGKDLWDKDSAVLLYHYLTITLKVPQEKAVIFAEAIANKDYEPGKMYYNMLVKEGEISWNDEPLAQKEKTLIQKLLHDADCYDVIRVRTKFHEDRLDFYKEITKDNSIAHDAIMEFAKAVKKLTDLEKADPKKYNTEFCVGKILLDIQENPDFVFLKELYGEEKLNEEVRLIKIAHSFNLPYINADSAKSLEELSQKIVLPDQKIWIDRFLQKYKIQGVGAITTFLEKTKSHSIEEIIESEKPLFIKEVSGHLYKYVKPKYWNDFLNALVNPESYRPGTGEYKELRIEEKRKPFTYRLTNTNYESVPTDKNLRKSLHGDEKKKKFTKHQSTSFANDAAFYNPIVFQQQALNSVQVGVCFDPIDCIIQRIFVYQKATYKRHYDYNTKEEADEAIKSMLENGLLHESLFSLQERELLSGTNRTNEVMAGFRWTTRSSITVFTDNLESRLLAQLRAVDLKNRFEAHTPGITISVPITIYPGFTVYDKTEQAEDFKAAEQDNQLKKYTFAIKLLSGMSDVELIDNLRNIPIAYELLNELNPAFCNTLKDRICKMLEDRATVFFMTLKGNEAISHQWISSEKLTEFNDFLQLLKKANFEKQSDTSKEIVLNLLNHMDYFIEKIQNNKTPASSIDSFEKLKIFLKCNKNKLPNGFDIKNHLLKLMKSDEDILTAIDFPNSHLFEIDFFELVNKHQLSDRLRKMIINSNNKINSLLVAAKGSVVLSISDFLSLIEENFTHIYRHTLDFALNRDKIRREFKMEIVNSVYEYYKSLISGPDDFIKIYSYLNSDMKHKMQIEFSEKINGWAYTIQDFEKIFTPHNDPILKKIFFDVAKNKITDIVGNSIDNLNKLCRTLTPSEKKEVYSLLPDNWLLNNFTSAIDLLEIEANFGVDILKTFLDSDKTSIKTASEIFGQLCEKKILTQRPDFVSYVLNHKKTKTLIESLLKEFQSGSTTLNENDLCFILKTFSNNVSGLVLVDFIKNTRISGTTFNLLLEKIDVDEFKNTNLLLKLLDIELSQLNSYRRNLILEKLKPAISSMINATHLFKTDFVNDLHSNHPEVLKIILNSVASLDSFSTNPPLDSLLRKNKKIHDSLIQSILKEVLSRYNTLKESDICFTLNNLSKNISGQVLIDSIKNTQIPHNIFNFLLEKIDVDEFENPHFLLELLNIELSQLNSGPRNLRLQKLKSAISSMINTTHLFKTDCVNDFHSNHPEVLKIILKSLDPLLIKNKKIDENLIQSILKELQSGSKTLNENDICFTLKNLSKNISAQVLIDFIKNTQLSDDILYLLLEKIDVDEFKNPHLLLELLNVELSQLSSVQRNSILQKSELAIFSMIDTTDLAVVIQLLKLPSEKLTVPLLDKIFEKLMSSEIDLETLTFLSSLGTEKLPKDKYNILLDNCIPKIMESRSDFYQLSEILTLGNTHPLPKKIMDYISNQLEKNISQINEYSLKSLFELDASLFPGNMRAIVFEALKKKIPNFTFEEFISFFVLKNDQLTIDQREFIWENTIKKWAASPLNVKKLNLGNLLELFSLPVKMFSIEKRTDFFDALFKNLADLEFKSCYYHLLPVFYSLTIEKLPIKHRETYMLLFLMKIHSFDQLEIDDQKRISALFDNKKTGMLTIESVKFLFEKLPEDKKFNLLNTAILSKVILNKEDFDNFLLFLKSTSPDASKHVFNLLRSELGILEASYDNYLLSSLTQKTNFSSGFFELPSKNNHATASTEKLSGELTLGNKPFILYIKNLSGNMIRIDMNDDSTFLTVLNKLIAEKIYDPNLEVFRCFAFGGRGYYEDDFDKPLRDLNIEHTDEIYLITHHFIKYEPTKEATPNTASFFGKSTNTGSTAADASAPTPSRLGPKGSD